MELSLKIPAAQRQEKRRYPDSVIEDALLGVFIILPLGVDINPIDGQVFPYLSKVEQRSKVFWLVCTKGYLLRQEIWGHSTCMISPTGDQTSSAGRGVCVCVSLTLSLNSCLSSMVSVSALAMTGTMLTIFPNLFMNSTSMGRNLEVNQFERRIERKCAPIASSHGRGVILKYHF